MSYIWVNQQHNGVNWPPKHVYMAFFPKILCNNWGIASKVHRKFLVREGVLFGDGRGRTQSFLDGVGQPLNGVSPSHSPHVGQPWCMNPPTHPPFHHPILLTVCVYVGLYSTILSQVSIQGRPSPSLFGCDRSEKYTSDLPGFLRVLFTDWARHYAWCFQIAHVVIWLNPIPYKGGGGF